MQIEVSGCKDCPFRDEIEREILDQDGDVDEIIQYYCTHPRRWLIDLYENDEGVVTPSDCPLLTESTTISINTDKI